MATGSEATPKVQERDPTEPFDVKRENAIYMRLADDVCAHSEYVVCATAQG